MLLTGLLTILMAIPLFSSYLFAFQLVEITSIILLYSAALSFNSLYVQSIGSGLGLYSGLFHVSSVTQYFEIFIFIVGAIIVLPWYFSKKESTIKQPLIPEYGLIVLFTTLGASFLISSCDLVSMYLSIELQSFAVYILAALYRNSESATSAGLKYFLLGALSSALILLGSSLVYGYTGVTSFESLSMLCSLPDQGLTLGILLVGVGFLFKVTAAPFHNWAPDVYDGVPTIVTTWLTVMPKISIFILLLELQNTILGPFITLSDHNDGEIYSWKLLLLYSSMLSLLIGTIVGLNQIKIKRLLAYSTISHVGFLLLGLVISSQESISAFMFYLIQYSLTNLNAFLILLAFGYLIFNNSNIITMKSGPFIQSYKNNYLNEKSKVSSTLLVERQKGSFAGLGAGDVSYIEELKGQYSQNPVLSLSLCVSLFSMAGIPPLVGFFGKYYILYSSSHSGYYFLSVIAILTSVISASYYLKIVRVLNFEKSNLDSVFGEVVSRPNIERLSSNAKFLVNKEYSKADVAANTKYTLPYNNLFVISNVHSFCIAVLTLSISLFLVNPSLILNSTHLLSLTLYNI